MSAPPAFRSDSDPGSRSPLAAAGPGARAMLAVRALAYPAIRRLRASRAWLRWRFGVHVPPGLAVSYDTTTVALRRTLARRGAGAGSALDVGTGQAALLAISFARRFGRAVDAVDVSEARVESSRRVAELNRVPVRVWRSDLLAGVTDRYDLIFSNPPYVPTAAGRSLDLTAAGGFDGDQVWDGGADGTGVIARLLEQAPARLTEDGRLIIGVQPLHVADPAMRRLATAAGFTVEHRDRPPLSPSTVWVLAPARGEMGRDG